MTRRLVWIGVGSGAEADRWRERLGPKIDRRFGTRSVRGAAIPANPGWPEPGTGQILADVLLDALIARFDEVRADGGWLLGLTAMDLGAPGRPFVFGEATVGGCCALVSQARLEDRAEWVFTTLVHELMHVVGLDHCDTERCVMLPSATVADTDRKGDALCGRCEDALGRIRSSHPSATPA